jgi:hypothetical protein
MNGPDVYVFGMRVTGLPDLPASPIPIEAGSPRSVLVRVVGQSVVDQHWRSQGARRIVDLRLPDGGLFLGIDEDDEFGYRVEAPEIGVHLVGPDGTEILLPQPRGPDWFWQRLLFAQTLPLAAALQGVGLFHASAVRIGDHAVAVSAPPGSGKSSTATHLIAQGAEFFTDDVLAVESIEGSVVAFAGPQFANVHERDVDAVDPARRERLGALLGASTKQHLRPLISQTSLPLGVMYLLERDDEVSEVRVDPLDRSDIPTLLGSAFVAHLDVQSRLLRHLEICGQLATAGQIYRARAPLHGDAAAVATALLAHSRSRLAAATA